MVLPLLAARLALLGPATALGAEAWTRRTRLLLPHLAALAVYLALRTAALSGVPAPVDPPPPALLERLAALGWIVPRYLGLLLWPSGLTVFHAAGPPVGPMVWASAALGWAAVAALVALQIRKPSAAGAFGLLWAALTFAPASGLVAIPATPVAERFLYLPLAGIALVAADLLARLHLAGRARLVAGAAVAAALLALAARAAVRTADWRDDAALFGSAVRVDPGSVRAWFNLGVAEKDRGDLAAAGRAWEAVLALDPRHASTQSQLGTLHAVQGDLAGAERLLRRALEAEPGLVPARQNLALVLERLGRPGEAQLVRAAAP